MDCLSPASPVQRVALMKGAQIGGTECGNCWIGYVIHQAPGPMMAVSPTVELAKRNSKQRIDPLIEESEVLRERVKERRCAGQRQYGAVQGVPGRRADLDRRQQRGRAALDAGAVSVPRRGRRLSRRRRGRGRSDPAGRKTVRHLPAAQDPAGFDPKTKSLSRNQREYEASDQRRYFVPCPHCHEQQTLELENLRWSRAGHGKRRPLRPLWLADRGAQQDLDAGARRMAADGR